MYARSRRPATYQELLLDNDLDNLWPYFSEELARRLAQRTSPDGSSDTPSLSLLSFTPFSESIFIPHEALRLHETLYFHLCLTGCPDLEHYKTVTHAKLESWMKSIFSRRHQRTVIIHVTSASNNAASSGDWATGGRNRILSRSDLVFEQLEADYPEGAQHRLIQLHVRGHGEDGWTRTVEALGRLLAESFVEHIAGIEEDVRRLEAQRTLPGWNFCTFFIKKDAIALAHQEAHLWSKALTVFDELASLYQLVSLDPNFATNQSLSWLRSVPLDWKDLDGPLDLALARARILRSDTSPIQMARYIYERRAFLLRRLDMHARLHQLTVQVITKVCYMRASGEDVMLSHPWPLATACHVIFDREASVKAPGTSERAALLMLVQHALKRLTGRTQHGQDPSAGPIALVSLTAFTEAAWEKLAEDWQFRLSFYCQICELCLGEFEALKRHNHCVQLASDLAQALLVAGHYERALEMVEKCLAHGKGPSGLCVDSLLLKAKLLRLLNRRKEALRALLEGWAQCSRLCGSPERISDIITIVEEPYESAEPESEAVLSDFFQVSSITHDLRRNVLVLEIDWSHDRGILIRRAEAKLTGKETDSVYSGANISISREDKDMVLTAVAKDGATSVVVEGSYRLASLKFWVGNVAFTQEYLHSAERSVTFNIASGCSLSITNAGCGNLDALTSGDHDSLELSFAAGPQPITGGSIEIIDSAKMSIPPVLKWFRPSKDANEEQDRVNFVTVQNGKDSAITIPACGAGDRLTTVLMVGSTPPTSISWQIQVQLDSGLALRQERRTIEMPGDGLWEREVEWRRLSEGRMLEISRFRLNGREPATFASSTGDQMLWPGQIIQRLKVWEIGAVDCQDGTTTNQDTAPRPATPSPHGRALVCE